MSVVASFHLTRYPAPFVPVELVRFATQRRHLRAADGLRFAKVLGTARGRSMSLSADLRRWAMFAVWDDDDALSAFLDASPIHRHAQRFGTESYVVGLRPLNHHGAWGGSDPLDGATADHSLTPEVAVLTRATIRLRHLRRFYRAVPPVDAILEQRPGLLASVGIGEAPVGRQATFSLWASDHEVDSFAYRHRAHKDVVQRTRREGWYAEELFARFRPHRSMGTWDGVDPLARRRTDDGTTGASIP